MENEDLFHPKIIITWNFCLFFGGDFLKCASLVRHMLKRNNAVFLWKTNIKTDVFIEVVAHEPFGNPDSSAIDSTLIGHINRVERIYKTQLKADEAWVVNFCNRPPHSDLPGYGYVWKNNSPIKLIHFYHNEECTQTQLIYKNEKGIQVKELYRPRTLRN
jgi:hypothetical protein